MEVKLITMSQKGHIALDYRKRTRNKNYGFNNSQANVSSSNDAIHFFFNHL